jgi:hypothetical protein
MKSIIVSFIGSTILLAASMPVSAIAKSTTKSTDRHSIGGVHIGDTESQVYRRLGKPIRYTVSHSGCIGKIKSLFFSSGKVMLGIDNKSSEVISITTQNHNWKTETGTRVGDAITRAKRHYKLQNIQNRSWQVDDKDSIVLIFRTNKVNKIAEIELYSVVC